MARNFVQVTLIGFGAIGRSVLQRAAHLKGIRISHIVVPSEHLAAAQAQAGSDVQVVDTVPSDATLVLECAGHAALTEHVLPALARGVECAVLSIGALSDESMYAQIFQAAEAGETQVHLLAGAIGAIDAISAARLAGLDEVIYTGRKPPLGWHGTPAELVVNLETITEPTIILAASAREAARLYPKNANVAASLSLAGLGLDATQVQLIADPTVSENIHEVRARGVFGELHLIMRGKPLADNPKTSALTVLSALRFLHNRCSPITL